MTVPAPASRDVKALHGLVSGNDVLDGRREEVPEMRKTRRERRTVVKHELLSLSGECLLENLAVLPESERLGLDLDKL